MVTGHDNLNKLLCEVKQETIQNVLDDGRVSDETFRSALLGCSVPSSSGCQSVSFCGSKETPKGFITILVFRSALLHRAVIQDSFKPQTKLFALVAPEDQEVDIYEQTYPHVIAMLRSGNNSLDAVRTAFIENEAGCDPLKYINGTSWKEGVRNLRELVCDHCICACFVFFSKSIVDVKDDDFVILHTMCPQSFKGFTYFFFFSSFFFV